MYLSPHQVALLAQLMATLAEPHGEHEIRQRIGQLMLDLLGAQHYVSYVWQPERSRFEGAAQIGMEAGNLARYEAYHQYHDPITPRLQPYRRAVCVNEVMPQADLKRTEFFNDFLARDGLHWGLNVYAWQGDHNIGDMRIWRDRRRPAFSREDAQLVDLVRPAFTAALARCRSAGVAAAAPAAAARPDIGPGEWLSPRQREVAHWIARGLSDKEVARRLNLSVSTVRTHVDEAFRKLGVRNRLALVQRLHR